MSDLLRGTLYAALLGIFLGALYDAVKILRMLLGVSSCSRTFFHRIYQRGVRDLFSFSGNEVVSTVVISVFDFLYFVLSAVIFILFLYVVNYGIFRWFFLLFAILGFMLHYYTAGRVVSYFSWRITDFIKLMINVTVYVVTRPAVFVFSHLFKLFKIITDGITKRLLSSIDKRRNKRYTLNSIDRLKYFVDFEAEDYEKSKAQFDI